MLQKKLFKNQLQNKGKNRKLQGKIIPLEKKKKKKKQRLKLRNQPRKDYKVFIPQSKISEK